MTPLPLGHKWTYVNEIQENMLFFQLTHFRTLKQNVKYRSTLNRGRGGFVFDAIMCTYTSVPTLLKMIVALVYRVAAFPNS